MDQLILREIESQLSVDTELLLRLLGSSQSMGATPATPQDGEVILENAKRTLREQICLAEGVKAAHATTGNSKVLLVAAIVDCIAGATTGVSPVTVAVLLVTEGIDTFCKDLWSDEQ